MITRIAPASFALPEAAALLRAGELVAFPTETVYGLGADATNAQAVAKIYAAKGRPSGNPLIVHVPDVAAAKACVTAFPPFAEALANTFWPGPLTLVLPRAEKIVPAVSAGRATVAVRCPRHPVAQALLRSAGLPVAAPSANRSGFTSPTTAQHVHAELAGRILLILDGGPCEVGLESTVLDLTQTPPRILRQGAVTREMIEALIGPVGVFAGHVAVDESAASPGMHDRHYAPRTRAYRFDPEAFVAIRAEISGVRPVTLITHDPAIALEPPHETFLLPRDAANYARLLYDSLRAADSGARAAILILMPAESGGMWSAISDRLTRATEPWPGRI